MADYLLTLNSPIFMKKKFILVSMLCATAMFSYAQKVDFDMNGRQPKEVLEEGYQSWVVGQGLADIKKVGILTKRTASRS